LEYEKSLYYGFKTLDEAREIVNCWKYGNISWQCC
jgi:hypothetical protein